MALKKNSNSGGTINIVYKCTECNEEYVNKWHLTRHKNSMNSNGCFKKNYPLLENQNFRHFVLGNY